MSIKTIFYFSMGLLLVGCSPVKMPVTNQYQLSAYSTKQYRTKPTAHTLFVTTPEAVAGYQTEAMLYVKKPFQVEAFAKNAWVDAPAQMLYPLLVQSLQRSGYFYAVSSGTYAEGARYRLDTQVLNVEQRFLKKPSTFELSTKVVLTDMNTKKVLASRIINLSLPCPMDTPYGGVIAANQASLKLTAAVVHFVVSSIKHS